MAAKLAEKDPARAEAMVEAIPDPRAKVNTLLNVAKALPASERGRKQALLEQATTLLRDRLQQANTTQRHSARPAIAEQWLDMGERDRARLVLREGEDASIDSVRFRRSAHQTEFLAQLARLEPDQAWRAVAEATGSHDRRRHSAPLRAVAAVAVGLATDHPAEAERVFNLRDGSGDPVAFSLLRHATLPSSGPSRSAACPSRRRVAVSGPAQRACAWAYVALGLAEKGQGRRLRGDGPRDPGDRSAAGIGAGPRTRRTSRRRPLDVPDQPRRRDTAGRRAGRPRTAGRGLLASRGASSSDRNGP